ncbi:Holliday junction resolvase RuvX [bacterium]|nr:Holliday junction resolvase RuvX [bacterium]
MTDYPRILALDYGEKRIGVAISDPLGMMAHPLAYVPAGDRAIGNIKQLCHEYDIAEIMLGLPKKMDGTESTKAGEVRAFGDVVAAEIGLPIVYRDERFSTVAVTRTLIDADMSRKKRKEVVDSQSAAFVLQGYLDYKKRNQIGDNHGL